MAGLIRRFTFTLKAGLDALLAPAEDPRQAFVFSFERQRQLLAKVQRALQDINLAKQGLEAKTAEVQTKLPQLEEQARRSLLDDREDLARLALQRAQIAKVELQTMRQQLREIEQDERRMSLVERRLAAHLEAYCAHQEFMTARHRAAETQVQVGEALTGVSEELAQLGWMMERAERKSELMQARAAAIDRLVEEGLLDLTFGDGADAEFKQLPFDRTVEEWLAALKRELA